MDPILQTIRKRIRNKVSEDGIYLVYRCRYEWAAREVAEMVRQARGQAHVTKVGKMTKVMKRTEHGSYETFSSPWKVEFTVGVDEDLYLAGRIDARKYDGMAPHPPRDGDEQEDQGVRPASPFGPMMSPVSTSCCIEPMLRGGKCENCGQWLGDWVDA